MKKAHRNILKCHDNTVQAFYTPRSHVVLVCHNHTVKGVQFCLNKGSCLSPKRDNSKELKYIDGILQYSSPVPLCQLHN